MASAKAKIRHVFGDTFSCRAAPPDILVKLSGHTTFHTTVFVFVEPRADYTRTTCVKSAGNIIFKSQNGGPWPDKILSQKMKKYCFRLSLRCRRSYR